MTHTLRILIWILKIKCKKNDLSIECSSTDFEKRDYFVKDILENLFFLIDMIKDLMRLVWPGFDDIHEEHYMLLLVIVTILLMKKEMYTLGLSRLCTKLPVTK
jgi:hypothetical protein